MAVDLAQKSITIKLELGEERLHGCRSIRSRPSAPITNRRGDLYAPAEASRAPGGDRIESHKAWANIRGMQGVEARKPPPLAQYSIAKVITTTLGLTFAACKSSMTGRLTPTGQ